MIKKLLLIGVFIATVCVFSPAAPTYAHFIVEDTSTGVKALFHVTPDHDPIVGEESVISFDFSKTGFESKDFSYSLAVKPIKGDVVTVPLDVVGNVVIANYIFPDRGFYDITLTMTHKADGSVSKLQYGQRVSRGATVKQSMALGPGEMSAIAGTVVVAVGAIIFSLRSDHNKRKEKKK